MLLYVVVAEVLVSFTNSNKKVTRIQIGDHENKTANFDDKTTIF